MPRDTPIANRRLAKEKLTRMLERKYLFTVNDMVNYFGKIQPPLSSLSSDHQKSVAVGGATNSRDFHFRNSRPSASNNFALIMSSNDEDLFSGGTADDNNINNDDDEDDDDILASILSNVESKLKRRRRRRDSNEVANDNLKISKRDLDSSAATSEASSQLDLELDEIINNSPDSRLLISNCDPTLSGKNLLNHKPLKFI